MRVNSADFEIDSMIEIQLPGGIEFLLPPWQTTFFWIIATLTGLCAISVVVTQNIVRAAVWLLFTLAGVSALFFLLGSEFVAATQLIVYVGGTLVLVVFGVMLTAQGPFITMKTGPAEWAISTLVGLLFLGVLVAVLISSTHPVPGKPASLPRSSLVPGDPASSAGNSGDRRIAARHGVRHPASEPHPAARQRSRDTPSPGRLPAAL